MTTVLLTESCSKTRSTGSAGMSANPVRIKRLSISLPQKKTMRFPITVLSVVSLFALAKSAAAQLIAPDQPVAGQSQLSLAQQWCQWSIEQPVETNPILDNTGTQAFRGDQGSVFFLSADLTADPIVRTITVPAGEPLFTPIDAATNDNTAPPGQAPTNYTAAELLSALTPLFEPANETHFLDIDGVSQPNMYDYRQTTDPSSPFSYTTTSRDNYIDQIVGSDSTLGTGIFPSTVFPVVEDGYWAALEPFAPGSTHTLHFGAEGSGYGEDVTYVITTVPEPTITGALALVLLMVASRGGRACQACVNETGTRLNAAKPSHNSAPARVVIAPKGIIRSAYSSH